MTDTPSEPKKGDNDRIVAGRGPAYPYISLEKAVERLETLRERNMGRITAAPVAFYKALGFTGETGPSRQTLAALNHYGLIENVGRGDARNVRLSALAHRIIFDKIPNSPDRSDAVREAALKPAVFAKLWEDHKPPLPPDYVLETFLVRDNGFNEQAAQNVISVYKDTLEYADLRDPANIPADFGIPGDEKPEIPVTQSEGQRMDGRQGHGSLPPAPPIKPPAGGDWADLGGEEGRMKVLLDGDLIRVSAVVDLKGAKRLIKALKANMALLEDDEDDAGSEDQGE